MKPASSESSETNDQHQEQDQEGNDQVEREEKQDETSDTPPHRAKEEGEEEDEEDEGEESSSRSNSDYENDEGNEEGSGSDDSEDSSSSEDEDPLSHLSAEQRQAMRERQARLKEEFERYQEKELDQKVSALRSATNITEEEAKIALECCNNDEIEAASRITMEPEFLTTLNEILHEQRYEREQAESRCSSSLTVVGGDKCKIKLYLGKRSSKSTKLASQTTRRKRNSRKPDSGYKLDGTKRAENLRLADALAKLDEIRRQKLRALREKSKSSTCCSSQTQGEQMEDSQSKRNKETPSDGDKEAKGGEEQDLQNKLETGDNSSTTQGDQEKSDSTKGKRQRRISPRSSSTKQGRQQAKQRNNKENQDKVNMQGKGGRGKTETNKTEDEIEYTEDDLRALKWSEARIRAFLGRKSNPNAYYYRFNAPGEKQETGEWSQKNHDLFLSLIKDGVDYRWGIFSMKIPGRVGYQCSNYYRKLILEGLVHDPNYHVDETGKLKFVRPKGLKRGSATNISTDAASRAGTSKSAQIRLKQLSQGGDSSPPARRASGKRAKPKKKRSADDYVYADEIDSSDCDSDTGTYGYAYARTSKRQKTETVDAKKARVNAPQLIPGLNCPMTLEPVHDPALSPYGHIMGYDTWLRVLGRKPKNTCPFTKQKLTRRMLIKLTNENMEEYRSQIEKCLSCSGR